MRLSKHISDLLYRHECVIVPNFGGFIGRRVASTLNNHRFTPPSKQISFNINLNQNDGLLANHISQILNISYDEAIDRIADTVNNWNNDLENGTLTLDNIGTFNKAENSLVFNPISTINHLASSFGLSEVDANYILKETIIEEPVSEEIEEVEEVVNTLNTTPRSYKKPITIAASIALLLGGTFYVRNRVQQQEIVHQQEISNQIQQASFNILTPLPSLTLNVEKENIENTESTDALTETEYKYQIIAGAFKSQENADVKAEILIQKGYNAKVIGANKWGLIQVTYASFNNKNKAINMLNKIKRQDNKHAWLLINE